MLKKLSFVDCKPTKMPMSLTPKIFVDQSGQDVNPFLYRGMIGSLLYLTTSPFDILFVTSMCACFQANPKESHILIVKRFFQYLKHTPNLGLYTHQSSTVRVKIGPRVPHLLLDPSSISFHNFIYECFVVCRLHPAVSIPSTIQYRRVEVEGCVIAGFCIS
ncbi:unnamed protein product [Lactuca saligna]|uniref:Mitochondrial protein n=1 Tax=Lactuca saligna TaxID=75948 RepID=A0AA35YNG2_LACSI|nr:unnamed protein product [Lactuca saligna]